MDLDESFQFDLLFEDIPPRGKKNAVVVVGRFNPPTIGHYKVFEKARSFIKNNPDLNLAALPVVFVIGNDEKHDALVAKIKAAPDKSKVAKDIEELKRNPLKVKDRIRFMKSSGLADAVTIIPAKDVFAAFGELRNRDMEPIAIAAGSDRINKYIDLLDKYFVNPDGSPIKHYAIDVSRTGSGTTTKKDDKESAVNAAVSSMKKDGSISTDIVSGSVARALADAGYEEEFANIVGLSKKPELAKMMFNKIKNVTKDF